VQAPCVRSRLVPATEFDGLVCGHDHVGRETGWQQTMTVSVHSVLPHPLTLEVGTCRHLTEPLVQDRVDPRRPVRG